MWKAKLKNGNEVSELNTKWNDIKDEVVELLLITKSNQIIYLPKNMKEYVQFKTAGVELGRSNIEVESRTVGFKTGDSTVKIRVDEKTNNIIVETTNG